MVGNIPIIGQKIEKGCPFASAGCSSPNGSIFITTAPCMKERCEFYSVEGVCIFWKMLACLNKISLALVPPKEVKS